jgi:hypothetical protein
MHIEPLARHRRPHSCRLEEGANAEGTSHTLEALEIWAEEWQGPSPDACGDPSPLLQPMRAQHWKLLAL